VAKDDSYAPLVGKLDHQIFSFFIEIYDTGKNPVKKGRDVVAT
jgi:hypothetical protein